MKTPHTFTVLFVCLGNICRSPLAAGLFQRYLDDTAYSGRVRVDSAGTHDYQLGKPAYGHSIRVAAERACDITGHRARQVRVPEDFEDNDLLVVMDEQNLAFLQQQSDGLYDGKLVELADYSDDPELRVIDDPYQQELVVFRRTADNMEGCFPGLLQEIERRLV